MIELVKVYCPDCGTWLMMADTEAAGYVAPYCKRCKENKIIKLVPKCRKLPKSDR